jgi:hypothetical protein
MKARAILVGIVAAAILMSLAAFASADTVTYPGSGSPFQSAEGTVTVNATVNPLLTLTIETPDAAQTVDFGNVDPGATPSDDVTITVESNQQWDMTKTTSGDVADLGLSTSLAAPQDVAAGQNTYTDTYSLNVPWTTAPGAYTAYVEYSVTQE